MMQGKVTQVVFLSAKGSQNDSFSLGAIPYHHTKAFAEELRGIELLLYGEGFIRQGDVFHAVEREDGKTSIIELAQQVPALTKQLDAVRREGEGLGFGGLVATVGYTDSLALLHRLDDQLQIFTIRRDVLQRNAMLEIHALPNNVADGQGREHPVLHRVLVQHLFVADIVAVAVFSVAVDVDAKDVLNGVSVAVEGGAWHLDTSTHIRAYPFPVDVNERDLSCTIDGVDKPDVFLKNGRSGHVGGALEKTLQSYKIFRKEPKKFHSIIMSIKPTCSNHPLN